MTLGQSIWIGLCQVTSAVFPGTSRSMSTIAAGQLVSMTRTAALEFSFLISIPTMIAATGYDLLRTLHPKHADVAEAIAPLVMTGHRWIVLFIGFAVSFLIALLSGGVVSDVGPPSRLRHLRRLPYRAGRACCSGWAGS